MPEHYYTRRLLTYKVNRPLSRAEIRNHLPQKVPSLSAPWFQLTVIRMNSTFLECVDKHFSWRGMLTAGAIIPICFSLLFLYFPVDVYLRYPTITPEKQTGMVIGSIFIALMALAFLAFLIWALRSFECFQHTHYPMRFNRKTRMVHAFRPNGTVLSVPWEKAYFTLLYEGIDYWAVVGHVLSEDDKTVLDTFPLSTRDMRDDHNPKTTLYQQWEFVRRYMEEGPQELYNQVAIVLPVDKKKETFTNGFKRIYANYEALPPLHILFFPLIICISLGRWIAMRTCKIPHFPAEIEAESEIEPNDPYIRDEDNLASFDTMGSLRAIK